jgi:hypothetical protein
VACPCRWPNLPARMLDTDDDSMCFYATEVLFPKTTA